MYHQWKSSTPTVFEWVSVSAWTSRNPWNPSLIPRLPWLGIAALLGALVGAASSVAVLVYSNGKPVSQWSIQPTVYLAISSTVTNVFLYLAFSEGVNVAWWRRATKENTRIADLHRYWSFGNSFWAAVNAGKNFSLVALASVLVTLGPINTPLLQRALQVTLGHFSQPSNVDIKIVQSLPDGYTGYLSSQGETAGVLTSAFAQTVQAFDRRSPIGLSGTGCKGQCTATVRGAGFAADCSTSTTPLPIDSRSDQTSTPSKDAIVNETLVFGSYLSWEAFAPGILQLSVQFKDQQACDGNLQIRNCTLTSTAVDYPVIIDADKSTIEGYVQYNNNTTMEPTTLAGLYKALNDTYSSEAHLRLLGSGSYELLTTGATSSRYAVLESNVPTPYIDCTISFTDPSNGILAAVRELMFRTAIAAANSSDTQHVMAQETTTLPIYESRHIHLYIALGCTALGWLTVIPLLSSWWHVGRSVSMSPIETAKAFGAPLLRSSDSNADSVKLIKEIGERPVQYGATTVSGVEYRLEMNEPKSVRVPRAGERFAG